MAWPDDRDLPVEVEAAFGAVLTADPGIWSWTDLSPRLLAEPIRIRAGSSGGARYVSPRTCTVTLDNADGALTPGHPMSPYWPNVELGTPVRVRLRRAEDAFARTVPAVTPLNSNPYFENNAAGWFGYGATVARSTAWAHQGAASLLLTPDGVSVQAVADSEQVPVTVGATYRATAWVRCSVARDVHLSVNWYDASHGYMSTSGQPEVAVAANTATLLTFDATAPAGAAYASVNAVMSGTPPTSHLLHIDEAMIGPKPAGGWGVADSGQAWTTSGAADDFSVSGGVARHIHTTVNVLRRSTLTGVLADSEQVVDVAPSALLTGAALVTGLLFRYQDPSNYYWLRCEFNSGGTSVMLKITRCVAGAFTDLATVNPLPGVPYAAGSYLRVRASVVGSRLAMKVWNPAGAEPAGWTLTATDSSLIAAGATGMQSWLVGGNTNTLPVEARYRSYTVRVDRFSGFADQWEPTFVPTTTPGEAHSAVRVTASGLLRRLGQGSPREHSAVRRTLAASAPIAYWPFEDGVDAQLVASGIKEGRPLTVVAGVVDFIDDGPPGSAGSAAMVENAQSVLNGTVDGPDTGQWQVSIWCKGVGVDSSYNEVQVLQVNTSSPSLPFARLTIASADPLDPQFNAAYANVAGLVFPSFYKPSPGLLDGEWHLLQLTVAQSGANVTVRLYVDGALADTETATSVTAGRPVSVATLANIGQVEVTDVGVAHIAVHATAAQVSQYAAGRGYVGELATQRLARLAAEDGVSLTVPVVDASDAVPMGVQHPGAPLDLYRECEDADMGILHEQGFGLAYLPRVARYNQPVALTVDLGEYKVASGGGGTVLMPVLDDQDLRNELSVARRDGSSVVAIDADSQQRHGVYADSIELNLASDAQLADQAAWRLHVAGG